MKVFYFKAKKYTKRFNKNQIVWISQICANHLYIVFKWRGYGRYVTGIISKRNIDNIKHMNVEDKFAQRINSS